MDAFLYPADSLEIEGAVCFASFSHQVSASDIQPNRWLAKELRTRPNLVGYGTLDPSKPPRDQIKEIVDLGFRGIKLHPAAQKFHVFGNWAREVYALMTEHHLIADFHTGVHEQRIAYYHPLLFDEIAFHYPKLRMVLEHVGGWHFFPANGGNLKGLLGSEAQAPHRTIPKTSVA